MKSIKERLVEVLRAHPEGLSILEIREVLGLSTGEQSQLRRRIAELDNRYVIHRKRQGRDTLYVLVGERSSPIDTKPVDKTTRARILHIAGQRCQMCGRSVAEDQIRLHVDHKIPQGWGSDNDDDNLWALCSECNEGKRNFFASITDPRVQTAMLHTSVHVRMGELLKAFNGEPVPKAYLAIVAHTHDDFEKRLRELRVLGWRYRFQRRREDGRARTYFILEHWEPWPDNPAAAIRAAEGKNRTRKKNKER